MIPGCVCMSVGYLAILIIRNRPSEVGLEDFESEDEGEEPNESDEYAVEDSDDEGAPTRWQKMRLIFGQPFFVSICLSYFTVQLIKTLYSDWTQMYLSKSVKVEPYYGKLNEFIGVNLDTKFSFFICFRFESVVFCVNI